MVDIFYVAVTLPAGDMGGDSPSVHSVDYIVLADRMKHCRGGFRNITNTTNNTHSWMQIRSTFWIILCPRHDVLKKNNNKKQLTLTSHWQL